MIERFKKILKENGQSIKWFYDKHIKTDNDIELTYSGFAAQLNGYASLSSNVEKHLNKYMEL